MTIRTLTELMAALPGTWNSGVNRGPQGVYRVAGTLLTDLVDTIFARGIRANVQAATAGALAAYTRVGAVITADANGALGAIDGETLTVGQRLLLKDGAAGADNGLYVVTAVGDGSNPFVLTRADDLTTGVAAAGATVFAEAGTANGGKLFGCTSVAGSDVVGTDALTWAALADTTHDALADGATLHHDTDQVENLSDVTGADATAALNLLELGRMGVYKNTIDTSDLTDAAVAQAVVLAGFPANAMLVSAWLELDTEFSGGGAASCTADLGDAGADNEIVAAEDVFTGAGAGLKAAAGVLVGDWQFEAAYAPLCTITSDVNVDTLTAGSLVVNVLYYVPTLDTP